MPDVFVEDVLNLARVYLNDQNIQLWTDTVLMPMFARAYGELQVILRQRAAPIMKTFELLTMSQGETVVPLGEDVVSPIEIYETFLGGNSYAKMTEFDPIPANYVQAPVLNWWHWDGENVITPGATLSRQLKFYYWRQLPTPTDPTNLIIIIDGEMWLAPRTAAIAAASVGEEVTSNTASSNAAEFLEKVILANRGRAPQAAGVSVRP